GEPLAEGGLGLDLDLELAAGEEAHAAGVHGSERDDDRLAGYAEPVEDLEDALDLGERDGGERHHASVTTPSAPAGAGPCSSRYQTRSDSTAIAARSWFEMPNSGQRMLMPPSGSTTPW